MSNIRIGNEQISVEVANLGAEMQRITTADGREWLWSGDAKFWGGRSPVLFPIVGRAPDDHVSIAGQRYPMGQHGFARRSEFTLVESGADFCRHELVATDEMRAIYPFAFRLTIIHRVVGKSVSVTAEVHNGANRPMPYGIGFHPAFVWPLPGAAGQDHRIELDNHGTPELRRVKDGLIDAQVHETPFRGEGLVLDHQMFFYDAMIFPEGAGTGLRYGTPEVGIHFTWENLPNFALWSKTDAPFICLEPWHGMAALAGAPDAIEERPYGEVLGPGATARYGFKAEILG